MSRQRVEALRQQRHTLIKQAGAIFDAAEAAGRVMSADERQQFDRMHSDAGNLKLEITQLEQDYTRQRAAEDELSQSAGRHTRLKRRSGSDVGGAVILKHGKDARGKVKKTRINPTDKAFRRCTSDYRKAFRSYLTGDGPQSANQLDTGAAGGYLAPEQFHAELIRELDEILWIRRLARTFMIDKPSMGVPFRNGRVSSLTRGAELGAPTADASLKFGKRTFKPEPMTGQVDLSRDLRRSSEIDVDSLIISEINNEVGTFEEAEFMTGTGAALQALGMFTASNDGIPTSRDVTALAVNALDADVLRKAKYAIKQQYRSSPSLRWVFHRDAVSQISQLKDANGRPLWSDGLNFGDPDMVLGIPVAESEYAPNTFTTGSYVGLLGDLKYYWIVDGMGLEIQVLVETGAKNNKDEIIYRRKMDAQPVLAEAFARIKLA